jgi:hypothetical protein
MEVSPDGPAVVATGRVEGRWNTDYGTVASRSGSLWMASTDGTSRTRFCGIGDDIGAARPDWQPEVTALAELTRTGQSSCAGLHVLSVMGSTHLRGAMEAIVGE